MASSVSIVDEMMSHLNADFIDHDPASEVATFYANRSVFITGGTGFIGKALIEKLLRSCKDIKLIFLLIREKRGKVAKDRIADLIQSPVFERIKSRQNGNQFLEEKLRVIIGDITLPKFGISQQDMETLSREVSIVFNCAATIRFNEPIDAAVKNNVYSVRQLVEFCDGLSNLQALIHLSTAYSNCHKRDTTHEIFYKPPMGGEQILSAIEELKKIQSEIHVYPGIVPGAKPSDADMTSEPSRDACELQPFYERDPDAANPKNSTSDLLEEFAKIALRRSNRPNSYTLTKAISEHYLLDLARARSDRYLDDKIPVVIVRPSIVAGTWREPEAGFLDNLNGPSGLIIGLYTGVLQAVPGSGKRVVDLVPVDMTANVVICSAWHSVTNRTKPSARAKQIKRDKGAYIFNFVSGYRNPVRWEMYTILISKMAYKYPTKYLLRLPSAYFVAGQFFNFYDYLNHKCPAAIQDFIQVKLLRRELTPRTSAMNSYRRVRAMLDILMPFALREWRMSDSNVVALHGSLSEVDKHLFQFDVTLIDWKQYLRNYIIGLRIYVLKDYPTNVPDALKEIKKKQMVYRVSMTVMLLMFYYFFCRNCQLESALLGAFERLRLSI